MVKICVAGCLHGELDKVYSDIAAAEKRGNFKTDLVLCCGDFQSLRNPIDLSGMSVPTKYYAMGDFWRYYAEKRRAPIPTVFIGGNHESSGYLQELPYGGWAAPNIWYMGYAGVVQFAGLRIAGLSGIYKQHDYTMGHYEHPPYSEGSKRSVYHVRNLDVFRLGQLRRPLDIVLSHDWPRGVYHYGDAAGLIRRKRHFADEIGSDSLGSPPAEQLMCRLRPRYWFSAHLHCKFAAVVQHGDSPTHSPTTRFLALDKCLPNRDYLQFMDIEPQSRSANNSMLDDSNGEAPEAPYIVSLPSARRSAKETEGQGSASDSDASSSSSSSSKSTGSQKSSSRTKKPSSGRRLFLDPEWLCVLRSTNHLMSTSQVPCILPGRVAREKCDLSATDDEIRGLHSLFGGRFAVPKNFERTAPAHKPDEEHRSGQTLVRQASAKPLQVFSNPQTELLCAMLELINPNAVLLGRESYSLRELSSQMEAKQTREAEEAEDEEEEPADAFESCCTPPPPDESWISNTDLSNVQTSAQLTEYDPLDSVCCSRERGKPETHNPEELRLEDVPDDDEEDEGVEGDVVKTIDPVVTQSLNQPGKAYSPQVVSQSPEEYCPTLPAGEDNSYVPSVSKTNEEEIHLSGASDSDEMTSDTKTV